MSCPDTQVLAIAPRHVRKARVILMAPNATPEQIGVAEETVDVWELGGRFTRHMAQVLASFVAPKA